MTYRNGVKVFPVRLDSGQTASLRFDNTTVWITTAARSRRLLPWSAGTLLFGLGLAMFSNGLMHSVSERLGLWSAGLGVALILAGALGAAVGGILTWRAERHPDDSLTAADIAAARSEVVNGRVTVTVDRIDGTTCQFSGTGMAGARTANLFARLLSAAADPADDRCTDAAAAAR